MKLSLKIYITAAAVLIVTLAAAWLWSEHKFTRLEREVDGAKARAGRLTAVAAEKEREAARYKAKTEYLEQKVAEMTAIAAKQNEELEKLSNTTDSARRDVERRRNIRSVAATAAELCARLAELQHPCE